MPERVARRTALTAGIAVVVGACTVDPRLQSPAPTATSTGGPGPTTSAQPTATAPAFPGGPEGLAVEIRLAATAASVGTKWSSDLDARRALLRGLRTAHLQHATALAGADPTARPTTGGPSVPQRRPGQSELDDALGDLADAERTAAAAHRSRALAASGFPALLWGSMGAAAVAYADAVAGLPDLDDDEDGPVVATDVERRALPTVADAQALQDLVTQLHAVIYGYQLAAGQLSGATKDRALARLKAHRQLRDAVIRTLISRSLDVPDAAPAYVPSPNPTSSARATQLLRRMERALLPFVGLWLASAATVPDRSSAYGALLATDAAARSWGADLLIWPGWNG